MIGDFNEDRNYMLGVGNEFPDIFLQGVDENNSIVEISNMSVPEGDNWQVIFSIQRTLLSYVLQR